jgi:16S rRNA processing protein RimM
VAGYLVGVFGVKGWLKIKSFTAPEDNILRYLPWQLDLPAGAKAFELEDFSVRPQGIVVKLRGVDDRDAALALGRSAILVASEQLPALADGDFYWSQLVGLRVISEYAGDSFNLGTVTRLFETGANDVLVVQGDESAIDRQERLVPYLPGEFVIKVDLQAGILLVNWDPEF